MNADWKVFLTALKGFCAREGHARVPWNHSERGIRLGAWLSAQWAEQRAGRLSQERQVRLADAGVVWDGPQPPIRAIISSEYYNDRKWDSNRDSTLAERRGIEGMHLTVCAWERHWNPYSAATDVHATAWRKLATAPRQPRPKTASPPEPPRRSTGTKAEDYRFTARAKKTTAKQRTRVPGAGKEGAADVVRRQREAPLSSVPTSALYPLGCALHAYPRPKVPKVHVPCRLPQETTADEATVRGWISNAVREAWLDGPVRNMAAKVMDALLRAHTGEAIDREQASAWIKQALQSRPEAQLPPPPPRIAEPKNDLKDLQTALRKACEELEARTRADRERSGGGQCGQKEKVDEVGAAKAAMAAHANHSAVDRWLRAAGPGNASASPSAPDADHSARRREATTSRV